MSSAPVGRFRDIDAVEAQRLVDAGNVNILDVRTPQEYDALGHIPGATLLPLGLLPSAPATLPTHGRPLLVYCEHGIRSAQAAAFLAQAGFQEVLNLRGGFVEWRGEKAHSTGTPFGRYGPCSWLVENASLLPSKGRVLDVACGAGRHALLLAALGLDVHGVDRDPERIATLRNTAQRLGLPVVADVVDLEAEDVILGTDAYQLILGVHYLHRPLFPTLVDALAPGGVLFYETFTVAQKKYGKPSNPDYLLRHGELSRLVSGLEILSERDGEFEGRYVASTVARKPLG